MASAAGAGDSGAVAGGASSLVQRGRQAFAAGSWQAARDALAEAERRAPLEPDDVERLATAAAMLGRDDEWAQALELAYERNLERDRPLSAVRCAFWIGVRLARSGQMARASGWLARARRLLEREDEERVEHGYLLLPRCFQEQGAGELEAAATTAGEAAAIGERLGDDDLFALATHERGHVLVRLGRVPEGLALLDEAMLTVATRDLSPFVTGIVYCGTIAACQEVYDLRRAGEWTAALSRWCDAQPELLAFTGTCLVHRAELMQARGSWRDALEEAQRAAERATRTDNLPAAGRASYCAGELHRLQGDNAAAAAAYRVASLHGIEPQPGLALLRLAQGQPAAAAASIRRALAEQGEPLRRAALLPAAVEIALASGDAAGARAGCAELDQTAARYGSAMLGAMAAHARGAVELAGGDAAAALLALRRAIADWQALDAPYEAACARILVGLACRSLGDVDAATLELGAAREALASLGAGPDVAWVDSLAGPSSAGERHGLTPRELEVIRLVAAGRSNRQIAAELVISEHTVARHVQNIFAKLGVSSRTAAGAFAFEHDLL